MTQIITNNSGWGWKTAGYVTWPESSTDWNLAVFDWETWKIIKDWWPIPSPTTVVDNLTTQSSDSALSANQWYVLKWMIDDLMAQWKFLSLWNCDTWQPISFPLDTPYTYSTWDYFMVEVLDSGDPATNYRPNGSSYSGTASSTVETWEVAVWDYYVYDWAVWLLASNHWKTVSFANLAWQPTDNVPLWTALAWKQDNWIEVNVATAYGTAAKVWTTTAGNYTPTKWDFLLVNFVGGCNVDNPTLNIDWSGAKAIRTGSANATKSTFTLWNTASSNIKALLYYDWTYYRCWSTTNSNTTYSAMSVSEWQTGTATSQRSMRADYLKQIIKYHAVSDTAYDSTWDWATNIAPSKNAVYDKIESLNIPTKTSDLTNDSGYITSADVPTKTSDLTNDSWFITSAALPTKTSDLTNDSGFITSSALSWYQTTANLVTNLSNADNTHYPSAKAVADALSSAWAGDMLKSVYDPNNVAANVYDYSNFINTPTIPTKVSDLTNDAGYITSSAIPTDYVKTSWNQTIAWTKTFSTSPVVPSKSTDATNTATAIATEAQVYKKQDKLTTQTAYTSKGTATKVPTITTNTLWQVTAITETSITFPVTSVNGSTWAVTWLQTTANLKTSLTDNSDTYYPSQKAVKTAVDGKQNQHSTLSVTLTSAGWSSNTQTVTATGVTASNSVIVSPAPSSFSDYASATIYCSAQASNSLTFTCTTEPTSDITVNVLILN